MTNSRVEQKSDADSGRVAFLDGRGELPMLEVITPWSTSEIYLQGAHVTHFKKKNEPPLLFLSQCSRFETGQPIRGGVPVVFPWFGPREGLGQHGFARIKNWELKEFAPASDGSVSVRFRLPDCPEASAFPPFIADYIVTVSEVLKLQLEVSNRSDTEEFVFENCLHTYFEVSQIDNVSISGLNGVRYLDKVANFAQKTETDASVQIRSEVDRIYLDTISPVEIVDPGLKRRVGVEKQASLSTVVWNPWSAKAQQMPDFGNEEYERMVCVESGNVASNQIRLPPGEVSRLTVILSSTPL
jgi:glucose-6-phosphate 1-epimerase